MNGWNGKILKVDLTTGTSHAEEIPRQLLEEYLGGRGLGVRLMRESYQLDPFDPAIPLIFSVGPLCGTSAPASSRVSVVSRSPLTGTIYDCSAGGNFAEHLKATGFDALFITGRSPAPVTLTVTPDKVEIISAGPLWGSDIPSTVAALKDRGSVASIGPAGENGVLFANISMGEGNTLGRGGLGAVMGSKNLKAVTVVGDRKSEIATPELFEKARLDIMRLFKASPVIFGPLGISAFGTPVLVDLMAQRRMAPTQNFRKTCFEHSANYAATTIKDTYNPRKAGCGGCPIQCIKISEAGRALPEYETLSGFGALNNIDALHVIVTANDLCNDLGMDSISAAGTLSAWGEIRGSFPTAAELPGLLNDIAHRRGDGETLALGSRRLAEKLGKPELSMSVKSLELPAYDPRGAYGMALSYATSIRGGCHLSAYTVSHEILRKPVPTDRFSFSGKARIISIAEETNAAVDSLAVCRFALFGASLEEYAELLSGATGVAYSPERLSMIGRRIVLTERFYNCANGFSRSDDMLPERFFSEPGSSGDGIDIHPLDRARFDEELDKYYRIRGLNRNGCFDDADFLNKQL
ncbi:MAG: aldehyde ferredoxin oxidoreductase family protein [Desulfuromonadaceae bacterium]|nr:aldehyde ferredoxin oxidoreductase family protein [Desulfuromonadaceae bacterium]MDD2849214.1 aldehyde ferredoxin oxidoreductase family protein [Desulfuromonadaceae bacterium]MDD4129737.1 aldehyde ferredoxin oxidoreductase family protein [Desulfuromonadaceae bacterium]